MLILSYFLLNLDLNHVYVRIVHCAACGAWWCAPAACTWGCTVWRTWWSSSHPLIMALCAACGAWWCAPAVCTWGCTVWRTWWLVSSSPSSSSHHSSFSVWSRRRKYKTLKGQCYEMDISISSSTHFNQYFLYKRWSFSKSFKSFSPPYTIINWLISWKILQTLHIKVFMHTTVYNTYLSKILRDHIRHTQFNTIDLKQKL